MTAELPSISSGSARACLCGFIAVAVFALLAPSLRADVTGTILGTVTDTTGAGVPAATVSLHNANTGFERKAVTDGSGNYELLAVPAAQGYSIDVEAGGFRRSSLTGITLLVNQQLRTDFQLQVGEMKETVTVQGEPVQVESNSTQLGDVIDSGMAMQVDVIPSSSTYFSTRMEDGIVIADRDLQAKLRALYPDCFARCVQRREFMRNALGIEATDDVLPLSNMPAIVPPYFFRPTQILVMGK